MSKINVSVIGAAGYTGEELLRLLLTHPNVDMQCITSRSYAGRDLSDVFPKFSHTGLNFSMPDVDAIAEASDVVFLALPHGLAAEFAIPLLEKGKTVIDVSADFRLKSKDAFKAYYDDDHPAPDLLQQAVYGAPERYREAIKSADLIACPGCYPTSIALAACPVLASGVVKTEGIIVSSMSGVSGAGRKESLPLLFAECNESARPYNVVGHRHTPEIEQELAAAAGVDALALNFVPHLIPVTRGIHSTLFFDLVDPKQASDAVQSIYSDAYANEPFVRPLEPGRLADTKNVTLTNMCEIGFALDARTGKLIVSSAIDNLTKGAGGQAIQCMNIRCGFDETAGLV
jgi:N-acetyl-gamma-glutamyl-phosphate reductase